VILRFGITKQADYLRLGERRKMSGARVSYALLDVGDRPSPEQIKVFEDISFTLRTSNGTFRTTFRNRFADVNEIAGRLMSKLWKAPQTPLRVEDRAVSHALTSQEWATGLLEDWPQAQFEASDLLFELVRLTLPDGSYFITEPSGEPLQYVKPPFVVSVLHPEPRRYPFNRWIAQRALRRFRRLRLPADWTVGTGGEYYKVDRIPYVHPEARALALSNTRFQLQVRSIFDVSSGGCDVLRTMNIFNRDYFSERDLKRGAAAALASVRTGGMWIVGRTREDDFTNHVSFLARCEHGWKVLERTGAGAEMEAVAIARAEQDQR
jgi:hypothetical protein